MEKIEVVYRLLPVATGRFCAEEDTMLIAKGSHFLCYGHLSAVPVEEQSHNLKYCRDCLLVTAEGSDNRKIGVDEFTKT